MSPRVLVIVTRVAGLNEDARLLSDWGLTPGAGPWYYNESGSKVDQLCGTGKAVVIVQGDRQEGVGNRISTAVNNTPIEDICLLVHVGGGGVSARQWVNSTWQNMDPWRGVCAHVFSRQGDDEVVRTTIIKLGRYVSPQGSDCFKALLDYILDRCYGGSSSAVRDACRELRENLELQGQLGLKGFDRPPPPADPIATIIHDVVSYFDALLLDLQTAQEEPEYWNEERKRQSERDLDAALERLRFLVGDDPSDEAKEWALGRGLPFDPEGKQCEVLTRRAKELASELSGLESCVSGEGTQELFQVVRSKRPSRQGYLAVKEWLNHVAQLLEHFRQPAEKSDIDRAEGPGTGAAAG